MIGKVLGNRYEIVEKIGNGGMAIVYKARCRLLNRFVAVKVLRHEYVEDQEFVKRFNIEAQAAARLSHFNLVSVYDVGREDDIYYIVMEYIEGITLKQYIEQKGALPWQDVVNFVRQICLALEHAHKNQVIHRDIKPHNIMLAGDGTVKVTDFGIARVAVSSTMTLGGNTLGSVHYFSPEQARGGYVDEKSDIYSLGVVMYELLTGRVPFDGDTVVSIAIKHMEQSPVPPRQLNGTVPLSIQNIVLKAMRKEQIGRYQSVSAIITDINKAVSSPYDSVEPVDEPTTKFATKKLSTEYDKPPDKQKKENDKKISSEDKTAIIAAVIASFIIIGLFSMGFLYLFGGLGDDPDTQMVPNLVGKNIEEARDIYKEPDYVIIEDAIPYDEKRPKGEILSQDPLAKTKTSLPMTIHVEVSNGSNSKTMLSLKGQSQQAALNNLSNLNLDLKTSIQHEFDDEIANGSVIRHVPEKGVTLKAGDDVILYVSKGKEPRMRSVPKLVGSTLAEAENALSLLGLVVGKVNQQPSNAPAGEVIYQSIPEGEKVDEKTEITLTISTGWTTQTLPAPSQAPTPTQTQAPTASPTSTAAPTTPKPSDTPKVTPGQSSPQPSVVREKEKPLNIGLSNIHTDTVNIKVVEKSTSRVLASGQFKKEDNIAHFTLKGTGKVAFEIYMDDVLAEEGEIDFDR